MKRYKIKKLKKPAISQPFKTKYKEELNEVQLKAVKTLNGPVLVIAGAGSGKTRTLVYRVARLVEENVQPEHILLLTFTRKAAQEMLRRASKILDERCGKVSGGTFHSFANTVLRKYANLIGFNKNFTILDRGDSEDVVNLIRTQLGFHKKKTRFPRKKAILNVISKSINKDCTCEEVLKKEYPQFMEHLIDIQKIYKEYKKYKRDKSIMDYDDLLVYLKILLEDNDRIRIKLSNFYEYIMIDEYQDTNKLQADIAYLLASEHRNIMVVGDDSQSIYSFRGANFKNIIDFPKIFPNTKIITIEQNYRSTQPLLDLTNEVIKSAKEKYSKVLFTKKTGSQKPVFIETQNENYQSKFIVQRSLELREEGIPLDDIAVLFRNGWHSNDLEIELTSHNIPFIKYGGFKFIETAHVKDIIAHLKTAFNPLDVVSWYRILLLIEGIGPKTAEKIIFEIVNNRKKLLSLKKESKFSNKKYHKDLNKLLTIIKEIKSKETVPAEQIRILLKYYRPLLENKYDDFNKRINDLDSLLGIAERYNSLEQFLSDITLEPLETKRISKNAENEDEKLILSTIHSAKGLEWHTVFIISIVDGYLPSSYSLDREEEIEEERRLLYVAMTRAKENLYLIKPNIEYNGRSYFEQSYSGLSKISRFLDKTNIIENYVEKWALVDEQKSEYVKNTTIKPKKKNIINKIRKFFSYKN